MVDRQDLLVGLKHPLRRRILEAMLARGEPTSPAAIAIAMRMPRSSVTYHLRMLAELRMLRPAPIEAASGSLQAAYRPTAEVEADGWVRETLGLPRVEDEDGAGTG